MRAVILYALGLASLLAAPGTLSAEPKPLTGTAAWYGEHYRGKAMANGQPFDPDKLTAACWFYPMGTRVRVSCASAGASPPRSVLVTITDRGPAERLVNQGRVIDLSHAAFRALAAPNIGVIQVTVEPEGKVELAALPPQLPQLAQPPHKPLHPRRELTQKTGFR